MNCRPLGKYKVDVDDVQPLRPLDLMTGYMEPQDDSLPMWDVEPNDKLRRGHKFTRQLAEEWWEKWLRRYPERLQECQKWTSAECNVQRGDFYFYLMIPLYQLAAIRMQQLWARKCAETVKYVR